VVGIRRLAIHEGTWQESQGRNDSLGNSKAPGAKKTCFISQAKPRQQGVLVLATLFIVVSLLRCRQPEEGAEYCEEERGLQLGPHSCQHNLLDGGTPV
jgi:hypothetical protein